MSTTLLVIQHVDREGPDRIEALARERGMAIDTLRPDRGDPLPRPTDCPDTIALVLGGPMGVNERHHPGLDWLQLELNWLNAWHRQGKPVIGICLGAQMLAVAAGGSVEPLQVGQPPRPLKELGFGSIHWVVGSDDEPLLRGLDPSETVLHWHGDRIVLPDDAQLLGSSLHCAEQVFRIGRHAIGLQCHVEVSGPSLKRWISEDHAYVVSALGSHGPEQLQKDWTAFGETNIRHSQRLLINCLDALLRL